MRNSVDDLLDIGQLETYIAQSAVINMFISFGCAPLPEQIAN